MKPVRVLDATHVVSVCAYAAQQATDGAPPAMQITLTVTADAVSVRIAGDNVRAAALRALLQSGYDATAEGEAITVRGWSATRLRQRLAQLEEAVHYLLDQLAVTPRTAIATYEETARSGSTTGRHARNQSRHQIAYGLRGQVERRAGPLLPQALTSQPADPREGLLWRQCRWLEDEVDLLLGRHRAIATQAIAEHRLDTETARRGETSAEAQSTEPDHTTRPAADTQPAAVAAHDAPAEAGDPPSANSSGARPLRTAPAATSPARRGA